MEKLLWCFLVLTSFCDAFGQTDMDKKAFVFPTESDNSYVSLKAQVPPGDHASWAPGAGSGYPAGLLCGHDPSFPALPASPLRTEFKCLDWEFTNHMGKSFVQENQNCRYSEMGNPVRLQSLQFLKASWKGSLFVLGKMRTDDSLPKH
ncbi:C-reactive protein isoform X3 [Microcebus murinus]|uniref:C-reactive protein isoform X3 n=1 Tax=Microcebus murinus TaxID=30608 RepID=UPI0006428767|nr:C-reactive protein isoform X3 [Microcebus murinus]